VSWLGRNSSRDDAGPGVRQGAIGRPGVSGVRYRASRRGSSWRGLAFLVLFAVVVVGGLLFLLGPTLRTVARGLADGNPHALSLPFVSDIVREQLGTELTQPAGTSDARIDFTITQGETVAQIGTALTDSQLIAEPMVLQYLVVTQNLDGKLQTGTFLLRQTMTPQQIIDRLQRPPDPPLSKVTIALRGGLRIEQITAYLEAEKLSPAAGQPALDMDVQEFYQLATHPPADLLADYSFLKQLPAGNTLEGFLAGGVFEVNHGITPEELLKLLLDKWANTIGQTVVDQATRQGVDFYDILKIASIVERETSLDTEKPRIAGVYTNRLNPSLNRTGLMNAEPTVIYGNDSTKLRDLDITQWPTYSFWGLTGLANLNDLQLPAELEGYQSWHTPGLPPTPIDTPTRSSILAAMSPDTKGGFLYFYACPGSKTHVFAKTLQAQTQNIKTCPKPKATPTP